MVLALAGDSTMTTGLPLGPFLEDFFFGLPSPAAASPSPLVSGSASSSSSSGGGAAALRDFADGLGAGASGAGVLAVSSASGSVDFFLGFLPAISGGIMCRYSSDCQGAAHYGERPAPPFPSGRGNPSGEFSAGPGRSPAPSTRGSRRRCSAGWYGWPG